MKTLILEKSDISKIIKMKNCIDMCDEAFTMTTKGKIIQYPRNWLKPGRGGLLGTAYVTEPGYFILKLLTNGVQIILLVDYQRGTFVLMDGSLITDLRTGAGGAVSVRYLANENSETVGVLGSGNVAKHALWAICEEKEISYAKVFSRTETNRDRFVKEMEKMLGIKMSAVSSVDDAVRDVDIIVTATKATEPVLLEEHLQKGVHICALGNPPEIDPKIFLTAKVYLESLEQSRREGKLSNAIRAGLINGDAVFPELGEVILGISEGRTSREDITMFDCQGLTAQDAIPAWRAYTQMLEMGKGKWLDLEFGPGNL